MCVSLLHFWCIYMPIVQPLRTLRTGLFSFGENQTNHVGLVLVISSRQPGFLSDVRRETGVLYERGRGLGADRAICLDELSDGRVWSSPLGRCLGHWV